MAGRSPIPYDSLTNLSATDTSGGTDFFGRFWSNPYARQLAYVMVTLAPTSSAGVYRSDGGAIATATDGMFFPAGGVIIYLQSYDEVRYFRIRANAAGTVTFSATAFRWDEGRDLPPGKQT